MITIDSILNWPSASGKHKAVQLDITKGEKEGSYLLFGNDTEHSIMLREGLEGLGIKPNINIKEFTAILPSGEDYFVNWMGFSDINTEEQEARFYGMSSKYNDRLPRGDNLDKAKQAIEKIKPDGWTISYDDKKSFMKLY